MNQTIKNSMKGVQNHDKRVFKFCKLTIRSSPFYFILNLLFIVILALCGPGMSYAIALAIERAATSTENPQFLYIAAQILLFFLLICIGGNTGNITTMLQELYTNRVRRFSSMLSSRGHAKEFRVFGLKYKFLEKWSESFECYSGAKYRLK